MNAKNYPAKNFRAEVLFSEAYAPRRFACRVNLSRNESPWDMDIDVKRRIADSAVRRNWSRYPTDNALALKKIIASRLSLSPDYILVGNGSNELICAIMYAASKPDKKILTVRPSFSLYAHYARIFGVDLIEVELQSDLSFPTEEIRAKSALSDTAMTILCNPNNPTGGMLKRAVLEEIVKNASGLVLIDEAYIDFSSAGSVIDLVVSCPNLAVIRTFSKAFGLAGLRIGYMASSPGILAELKKILPPYNLDVFSEEAAMMVLGQTEELNDRVRTIKSERARLYGSINALSGWEARPSEANFLLFRGPIPSEKLFRELLSRGILVRNLSSFRILEGMLRVTVGAPEENDFFLGALCEINKYRGGDGNENDRNQT